jgi:PAS domain S-box-containing protein
MIDQALVVVDTAGIIQIWSAGAERLFGHDAASVVGQGLNVLVPPQYRERHWQGFHAAMAGDNMAIDRAAVNIPALHRNGDVLRLAVRLLVLRDGHQRALGAMAIFTPDEEPTLLPRL